MKLKLTLQRPTGPASDVVVTVDPTSRIADLAAAISAVDPYRVSSGSSDPVSTLRIENSTDSAPVLLDPETPTGDAPLASGATISLVGSRAEVAASRPSVVAALIVLEGPDSGTRFPLQLGTSYLGRDSSVSDVTLSDPLVSKRHARLEVVPGTVKVVDLNSANGLDVDGGTVSRVDLGNGATVRVGDTLLKAEISQASAGDTAPPQSGPVAFNRSPRVESRYPGQEYQAPAAPTEKEQQPFPWVAMFAPLILGAVFAFTGRGLQSLVFVAASPLLMLGTFLSTRAVRRRKEKLEKAAFDTKANQLESILDEEVAKEREVRRHESPSTAEVTAAAIQLGPLLWTRRPEHWQFLSLNLGTGTMPSRNHVTVTNEDTGLPQYLERIRLIRDKYRSIDQVPVTENLFFSGALGIAGDRSNAADAARSAIVQLTGLHSPAELVVTAIVSKAWTPEFEWLKWLPHTGSAHSPVEVAHLANSQATGAALLAALEELIETRAGSAKEPRGATMLDSSALVAGALAGEGADVATPPPTATPAIVVLISDDAPVDRARLVQVAERAADAGIYPVWVAGSVAELPAVARSFLEVSHDGGASKVGLVRLGTEIVDVQTEPVSRDVALVFARRLAPVVDAGALLRDASNLPRTVSMLSLLGPSLASDPSTAVDRWRENDSIHDRSGGVLVKRRAGKLRALVGSAGLDAMHLDLRTQGPHALVGGTTGSGKSEFLQAWVLGMAAEYSPDRVTFLFVDYKGGSAFADCVALPHCVGLVTDLSPHLVRRALTSLRAELHYREHLFNRKKAKDLLDLEKRGDPDSPPALVLVIDEFAALAGEVPEFVDGVVDIAQRGRSLGIHLIMATQRPAGVIKDNLRANTNLRIALRMADESDSMDVVGDKVAGTFDPSLPGRGIAKTGPGRLTSFQSGYAGGWTSDKPAAPSIDVAELRFGTEQLWESPGGKQAEAPGADEQGPTDQARLVANLIAAAKSINLPTPRRPWLDDLARVFDLTKMRQRSDTELVLGVSDIPQQQLQDQVYFRPDTDGNIAIYGAGGTGKTVTLRTLAAAAGITPRGGPIDVYGLDFGTGGLKMLEHLPHVGSIVAGDDPERIVRLLRMLRDVIEDRSTRYSAVNAGSIGDYRRIANAPDEKRILLLVDNFPSFRNDFESGSSRSPWYGVFQQILGEGRQLGMHVAITADRPGSVPTSVTSTIQRKVVHRLADEGSYVLLDMPNDVLGPTSPPGRALVDGLETQIAIVGGNANVAEQSKAIEALGQAMTRNGRTPATEVGILASEISAESLPASLDGLPVLGVSDDTLNPVGFEPSGTFVLAGPPASGRSNALASLTRAIDLAVTNVERYYIGNARSRLGRSSGWKARATNVEDAAGLAKEIAATVSDPKTSGKILVVIEQIADFLSTPADGPLVELIKSIKRSDHILIAESETSQWGSSWPLLGEVKAGRTGFLIQPDGIEGETILKTAIPRVSRSEFPVGRGFFIAKGRATRVQLPLVDTE
jgi:S-DNA-T family DNA segregation ATPase FtsK/SpoIIIE